jgi:hypothetical protein
MRIVLLGALALAACGKQSPKVSPELCAARVADLRRMKDRPPTGFPITEANVSLENINPPYAQHGQPIPNSPDPVVLYKIARKGQKPEAYEGHRKGPAYLLLDATVPVGYLRAIADPPPDGLELRLIVKKPPAQRAEQLFAMFPKTPKDIRDRLSGDVNIKAVTDDLARRGAKCSGVSTALKEALGGGGADVVGPALGDALEGCKCNVGDIEAFVALFGYASLPIPQAQFLTIKQDVVSAQPQGATIGDLAKALDTP